MSNTKQTPVSGLTPAEQSFLEVITAAEVPGTFIPASTVATTSNHNELLRRLAAKKAIVIQKVDNIRMVAAAVKAPKAAAKPAKPAAEKPAKPVKAKKEIKEGAHALNWAFRRLRRQAVLFFAGDDPEKRKALREHLETKCDESYSSLRRMFESEDVDMKKYLTKGRDFDDFLESFFSHVIHPGSQSAE